MIYVWSDSIHTHCCDWCVFMYCPWGWSHWRAGSWKLKLRNCFVSGLCGENRYSPWLLKSGHSKTAVCIEVSRGGCWGFWRQYPGCLNMMLDAAIACGGDVVQFERKPAADDTCSPQSLRKQHSRHPWAGQGCFVFSLVLMKGRLILLDVPFYA